MNTTVSFQNLLFDSASMIRPTARSLSATCARGVAMPGRVPEVWLFGNVIIMKVGRSPLASNCLSSLVNCWARYTSVTVRENR